MAAIAAGMSPWTLPATAASIAAPNTTASAADGSTMRHPVASACSRLGQRAVQVEHADQLGPLPGPVRHREDRPAMARQPGEHVVAILPNGLGDDDRGIGIQPGKDRHALLLAGDEAVLLRRVVRVGAFYLAATGADRIAELLLHRGLGRPTHGVGTRPQVTAGNQKDFPVRRGLLHFPPIGW
jgi:hypothetical protein